MFYRTDAVNQNIKHWLTQSQCTKIGDLTWCEWTAHTSRMQSRSASSSWIKAPIEVKKCSELRSLLYEYLPELRHFLKNVPDKNTKNVVYHKNLFFLVPTATKKDTYLHITMLVRARFGGREVWVHCISLIKASILKFYIFLQITNKFQNI